MIKTVFICDKCKQSWEIPNKEAPQVVTMAYGFNIDPTEKEVHYFPKGEKVQATWCRPCAVKYGMIPKYREEEREKYPTVEEISLEEKVIELLDSLGYVRE